MVALEIVASALVGGFAGLLLVALFDPRQTADADIIAAIGGALIAVSVHRALRS